MRQAPKPIDRRRRRLEQTPPSDETARFLRNLTSLPDAEFAATYSPAIHAVLARYADLPNPAAAKRELLLALKAALKRRRAFILPRFTQAEDSWRIRECATYAVAVAVLVEHALAPDRNAQPTDPDEWTRLLADPDADPDAGSRAALFHAIVPPRGRRWLAREPLVRTLVANYFTDTAPNELRDIVGPVVEGFGQERQALSSPDNDDSRASSAGAPEQPSNSQPPPHRPRLLKRALAWARGAFGGNRGPSAYRPPLHEEPVVTDAALPEHNSSGDDAAAPEPAPHTPSFSRPPPMLVAAPSSPPPKAAAESQVRSLRTPKAPPQRPPGGQVADLLDGLPAAPETPPPHSARPRDIGDHGASATRIGHTADYARGLMVENALRPTSQTKSFVLPGPAPGTTRQPLDIDALFPPIADPRRVPFDAIAAWIAFRDQLVEALRSGAQSANGERSLVHLLDVGVFLVWPHIVLPFGDKLRLPPQAIKAAMRTAGVLAVNRADRQDDRHTFPALTGDPSVTCRGVVTLPEYLWPGASGRPVETSTFLRPPAIYGQRHRRPH